MKRSYETGVTLIELMIVVIIVGILLAVGLPSFQGALQEGRRADAMSGLQEIANLQEKYLLDRGRYTNILDELRDGLDSVSDDGHYVLAVTAPGACALANCYHLTATPASTSPQAKDTRCTRLILNSSGLKEAEGTTPNDCWN